MSGSNIYKLRQKIERLQREISHFEAQQERPGTRPRDQATRTHALHCTLDRPSVPSTSWPPGYGA